MPGFRSVVPRLLYVIFVQVVAFSVPTGLIWYGWYKFCVEEELQAYEESNAPGEGKGFGGYGSEGLRVAAPARCHSFDFANSGYHLAIAKPHRIVSYMP